MIWSFALMDKAIVSTVSCHCRNMSLIYEVFGGIIRDISFKFLLKAEFGKYMCVYIYIWKNPTSWCRTK